MNLKIEMLGTLSGENSEGEAKVVTEASEELKSQNILDIIRKKFMFTN